MSDEIRNGDDEVFDDAYGPEEEQPLEEPSAGPTEPDEPNGQVSTEELI